MAATVAANDTHDNARPMPTEPEIIELLKQGMGVTSLWRVLREKYGPAKGTYGSLVYGIITKHNTQPKNDAANNPPDNAPNNAANDNHVDNANVTEETSTDLADIPFPLSTMDYCSIIGRLNEHEKTLIMLASIITRRRPTGW